MKKNLLFFAGAMLATSCLSAQITLNQAGYTTSPIGTDNLKVTTATSTFPSFAAATNANWDMSTVTDSTAALFARRVATSLIPATYADSMDYTFGSYAYKGNVQSAVTGTGIMQYGISINAATFSLPTGGPTDSLYMLTQNSMFSTMRKKVALPATANSSWSSSYIDTINFELTVALLSYVHAPGFIETIITEKDSVIGWGQMKVKTASGSASGYMNVLQVRTITTTTNNYYINGALASSTLLTPLNLTQGSVTKTYEQNFYRQNELTPLVNVQFSDSANTTPTKMKTHTDRLAAVSVSNVTNLVNVNVYPNPVTGRTISIAAPVAAGEWKYELVNIAGQTITTGAMQSATTQVSLPATVTAGVYYVRILNEGKQVVVKAVTVN